MDKIKATGLAFFFIVLTLLFAANVFTQMYKAFDNYTKATVNQIHIIESE